MPLLPRKSVLAIAAVTDIALNARNYPVAAKALASRHRLPPRHLEPVLQALVREGILKGVEDPGAVMGLPASSAGSRPTTSCVRREPWTTAPKNRFPDRRV